MYKSEDLNDWSGIRWHGLNFTAPTDTPVCGWKGELCNTEQDDNTALILMLIICGVLLTSVVLCTAGIKRYKYEMTINKYITVDWHDIHNANISTTTLVHNSYGHNTWLGVSNKVVQYHDELTVVEILGDIKVKCQDRKVLVDLNEMRELNHENINSFIGICANSPYPCILMAYAVRGCLKDIIYNGNINLDWHFKSSILDDITCGMRYLHQSPIKFHGGLASSKCVVDSRWTCKVTGHGLKYVRQHSTTTDWREINPPNLLWTAPEILQSSLPQTANTFAMADVFSFGIIAQEVILMTYPYGQNDPICDDKDIINNVMLHQNPPYRPTLHVEACSKAWKELVESCWQEEPDQRPTFSQIYRTINSMNEGRYESIVDNIIYRLETYTGQLEDRVAERSSKLKQEKKNVETILNELLPSSVAAQLSLGYKVLPETFDNATIFFSDIVGFTRISAQSDALQIVAMLNQMYSMFDDIAQQFDVYKVATIGDAYMVASGVPIRNGDKHGAEVCGMALALLDSIQEFHIPHIKLTYLHMRSGIHSGPCVAGVAGVKMPRYLLFGDTVDVAARMESEGEAMKIHISESTRKLIIGNIRFNIAEKGRFFAKDNTMIYTFWLTKPSQVIV